MDHELVKTLQQLVINKALHELVALFKVVEHLERMLVRETVRQSVRHATLERQ